jgi:membrane-associated phospholipid phosphatase
MESPGAGQHQNNLDPNLMTCQTFPWKRDSGGISPLPGLRHANVLCILLCFLFQPTLFAQNKYDFSQFRNEAGIFFTRPLHWEGNDWLKFGLLGAGTVMAMQADQPIRTAVLRDQRYYRSVPIEAGRIWGEIYMPMALFGGFALHSLIADDMRTRKIAFEIGQASLYAAAITYTMKFAFGRARPYTNDGTTTYHPFTIVDDDFHSLSSGHSTIAFVLSTVLSRNVEPLWLKILVYLPAVLTPISRVYQDQHWVSDNVLGAAIGYFVATWVVDLHEQSVSGIGMSSLYPFTVRITIN